MASSVVTPTSIFNVAFFFFLASGPDGSAVVNGKALCAVHSVQEILDGA